MVLADAMPTRHDGATPPLLALYDDQRRKPFE
jgi:hypothetical protein